MEKPDPIADWLARAGLRAAVFVLTLLVAIMAVMSWFQKSLDVSFMTSIFTLVGILFGWVGTTYNFKFGSSQSSANKDEQRHVEKLAEMGQTQPKE